MLTRLKIRNFKLFDEVEIELGNPVVFIGPNNSGKTSALQALALWHIGLQKWIEERSGSTRKKRFGVTMNRRDLLSSPVPAMNLLWKDTHVRDVSRKELGKTKETQNVLIRIEVEGASEGQDWAYGFEFDYANAESFYCRPVGTSAEIPPKNVPPGAKGLRLAYLPPMSGLAASETRIDLGAINVRLGEGRTAEVLRNLCDQILEKNAGWERVKGQILHLFGVELEEPVYIQERGEIAMAYRDRKAPKVELDLSSAGRGLQQTLLLLAHLTLNPGAVLLLDEPDAHLETLWQRQIYQLLTEVATDSNSQIIAASHSEVVLNEAGDKHVVVAFLGQPHRIDDRGTHLLKSLREIGFDHYYQAEQRGWVLYVEGSTDLDILLALARALDHSTRHLLESPYVVFVGNDRPGARKHFYGLREAKRDLVGFALFDRIPAADETDHLASHTWRRREIEDYLVPAKLLSHGQPSRSWRERTRYSQCRGLLSWKNPSRKSSVR
jgi:energy-coupling factor transporter ATP-binding protein EcfA2